MLLKRQQGVITHMYSSTCIVKRRSRYEFGGDYWRTITLKYMLHKQMPRAKFWISSPRVYKVLQFWESKQVRLMGKSKTIKHAFKIFADCRDPSVRASIVSRAPDKLIKTICNAALKVERGDMSLSKKQISPLKTHRKNIPKLTSPRFTVRQKRKFLTQKV